MHLIFYGSLFLLGISLADVSSAVIFERNAGFLTENFESVTNSDAGIKKVGIYLAVFFALSAINGLFLARFGTERQSFKLKNFLFCALILMICASFFVFFPISVEFSLQITSFDTRAELIPTTVYSVFLIELNGELDQISG